MPRLRQRAVLGLSLTALALSASASPAPAAVTIGQTGTPLGCTSLIDRVQPTVTSGSSYVVPTIVATGTITAWSTEANAGGGALTMKVYRPLGGRTYTVVGHDGFRVLAGGVLNTFSTSVPVKAGDVLGSSTPADAGTPGCRFAATGDSYILRDGNLTDGESGDFPLDQPDFRLNISAVVTPLNSFTLGGTTRNKKKGSATLTVDVPNPGELLVSGNGVKSAVAHSAATTVSAPGAVELKVRAKGKKKRKLNETGKVKVNVAVSYTPTGGDVSSQSIKVKLKKKL